MTFDQFVVAVGMLAEKKYPGTPSSMEVMKKRLTSGAGPTTHGATVGP